MALGWASQDDLKTKILRLKIKEGLRFDIVEKNEGGQYEVNWTTKEVKWILDWIIVETKELPSWDKINELKIFIKDNSLWEKYIIDTSVGTSLGRSLMNSLLNLDGIDEQEISVSLYEKGGFNNVAVRINDELLKWKYAFNELPAPSESKVRGKTVKDYFDAEMKLFGEMQAKFKKEEKETKEEWVSVEDIPF